MPSLLARLRSRATSSSTVSSQSPVSSDSPNTPSLPHSALAVSPAPLVDRRILQDVNSLLDSFAAEEPADRGLQPRTRKPTEILGKSPYTTTAVNDKLDEADENDDHIRTTTQATNDSAHAPGTEKRGNRILDHMSKFTAPGEWSTFGRHKDHSSPRLSDFGDHSSSSPNRSPRHSRFGSSNPGSLRQSFSIRNKRQSKTSSVVGANRSGNISRPSTAPSNSVSTPSTKSSVIKSDGPNNSIRSSPANTVASRRNPTTPSRDSRPRSNTTPAHSFKSRVTQSFGFASPGTFGHPTPPEAQSSGFSFGSKSPPPPLPPLNHPELNATLPAPVSILNAGPVQNAFLSSPTSVSYIEKTFPRRSRKAVSIGGTASSLPSDFTRSSRSRSRLPSVVQLFALSRDIGRNTSLVSPSRAHSGSDASTGVRHERRSSADWSARQATDGVNSESMDQFGWPAEVSREILRLSLSGPAPVPADKDTTRGNSVPRTIARSSAVSSPPIPISPYPPSPTLPLSPPATKPLSSAPTSGRTSPSSFHSLASAVAGDVEHNLSIFSAANNRSRSANSHSNSESAMPEPTQNGILQRHIEAKPFPRSRIGGSLLPSSSKIPEAGSPSRQPTSLSFSSHSPKTPPGPLRRLEDTSQLVQTPVQTPRRDSTASKGKRKAEEEGTPPDVKKEAQHTTFAIPADARTHRASGSSRAPSSYQRKRARLSTPLASPSHSRPGSVPRESSQPPPSPSPQAKNMPSRASSRPASTRSHTAAPADRQPLSRSSMSQVSIPISALVSPHAPSISKSGSFHMRDPRKPQRRATGWGLSFRGEDTERSPVHAWCFFVGFVIFPLWWFASFWRTPTTRRVGGTDTEKAVTLDDPQVEFDAKSWRFRCRVMSIVSFLTYIPFIILIAIFAPR